MGFWIYPIYAVLAALIVFLSYSLGNYVDMLDKKTKISGAFIGGILLAAITSLPELFTSISSIAFLNETGMVVGNILGSNLFNLTLLAFTVICFVKKYKQSKLDKIHVISLGIVSLMTSITLYAILAPVSWQPKAGPINFLTIVILGLYILNLILQPKESEADEQVEIKLSLKQIIFRFVLCAVLLVGVSIAITYATDELAAQLNLGPTVAGSLFLAIATSLPEVVSTFTLCKKGNFNAGFGNIIGSNVFNFLVLVIGEFISWKDSIFKYMDSDGFRLAIFLVLSSLVMAAVILLKLLFNKKERTKGQTILFYITTIGLSLITFASYFVYLCLPFDISTLLRN